jgi:hypothetical protein
MIVSRPNYAKTTPRAGTNVTDELKALMLPGGGRVLADGVHGTLMQGSRGGGHKHAAFAANLPQNGLLKAKDVAF